jgi:hypothetical protein
MLKVLSDESIPNQVRGFLAHHETFTAVYAGFGAYKNGAPLRAAEDSGFEVLVTADQTPRYEQNLAGRKLALVCLSANSWKLIGPQIRKVVAAVNAATPGPFTLVDCGRFVGPKRPPG